MGGSAILLAAAAVAMAVWAVRTARRGARSGSNGSTLRCPHCGAPAQRTGNRWECGWCGDFGYFKR